MQEVDEEACANLVSLPTLDLLQWRGHSQARCFIQLAKKILQSALSKQRLPHVSKLG
jgi:hypothetical protein